MSFHPHVNDQLMIENTRYAFQGNPSAPMFVHATHGRTSTVYQLKDESTGQLSALKALYPAFQGQEIVANAEALQVLSNVRGLQTASRLVLQPDKYHELINQHPELAYSILMDWIDGSTWQDLILSRTPLTLKACIRIAERFTRIESKLSSLDLAHCDLSGSNVIISRDRTVELLDLEGMYGRNFRRPVRLFEGSSGYKFPGSKEAIWNREADRFAGAILLTEMLIWHSKDARAASYGDTFFAQSEFGESTERYRIAKHVLESTYSRDASQIFDHVWNARSLSECPPFKQWLGIIPQPQSSLIGADNMSRTLPSRLKAFATARVIEAKDSVLYLDQTYSLEAGISVTGLTGFLSRPFLLLSPNRPVNYEITVVVRVVNLHIEEWQRKIIFHPTEVKTSLTSFKIRPTTVALAQASIDFYREMHWLQTLTLEFEVVEPSRMLR